MSSLSNTNSFFSGICYLLYYHSVLVNTDSISLDLHKVTHVGGLYTQRKLHQFIPSVYFIDSNCDERQNWLLFKVHKNKIKYSDYIQSDTPSIFNMAKILMDNNATKDIL